MTFDTKLRQRDTDERSRDLIQLVLVAGVWAVAGVFLWLAAGPPSMPSPDAARIREVLSSSEVASSDAISVASVIGWSAFIYISITSAVRIIVSAATRVTDGAAWARTVLRMTDFAMLPPVRRVVDGAVIGAIVLGLWMKDRSGTEASTVTPVPVLVGYLPTATVPGPDESVTLAFAPREGSETRLTYTLTEGETLWSVAKQLYGDGTRYTSLFVENQGRTMPGGGALEDPRIVVAGTTLRLPPTTPNLWQEGEQAHYRVQPGDSLWRISTSLLGSGFRWTELWDLNQGRTMEDGRTFTNPDLIVPGWVLVLPVEAQADLPAERLQPVPSGSEDAEPEPPSATEMPSSPTPIPTQEHRPLEEGERGGHEVGATDTGDEGRSGFTLPHVPWPGDLPVLTTAAGLAGLVATYLLVRRVPRAVADRRARSVQQERHRSPRGDAGQVALAVRALMSALADAGFAASRVTLVTEAAKYQDCLIECPPGDADALVAQRFELARLLACGVDAQVLGPTEVRVRLSRFQRLVGLLLDEDFATPSLLVPVGGQAGCIYYLNLAAAGSVLIVGTPEERHQVLSDWIETLAATYRPDELSVLIDGNLSSHLSMVAARPIVQVSERQSPMAVLDEIEDVVLAREGAGKDGAPFLLGIADATDVSSLSRVETMQRHGRDQGVAFVTTADPQPDLDVADFFGAMVAFNHALADFLPDWEGDEDLVLLRASSEPIGLFAVDVQRRSVPSLASRRVEDAVPTGQSDTDWWFVNENDVVPHAFEPEPSEVDDDGDDLQSQAEDIEERSQDIEGEYETGSPIGELQDEPADTEGMPDTWEEEAVEPDEESSIITKAPATSFVRQLGLEVNGAAELNDNDSEGDLVRPPTLTVQSFGRFDVSLNGKSLDRWRVTKSRELLAFLLCQEGAPVNRLAIIDALWPDSVPAQAEHMLSNAIYYLRGTLRQAVGEEPRTVDYIKTLHRTCQTRMEFFNSDAGSFNAHLRRAEELSGTEALIEYERGLTLYRDDLLAKEHFDWAGVYREEFHKRFIDATRRAGKLALECTDTGRAIRFFGLALDQDAIDEESVRGLMLAYAGRGDVNGVKKAYRALCEALRRELDDNDAKPLPITDSLLQELTRRAGASVK